MMEIEPQIVTLKYEYQDTTVIHKFKMDELGLDEAKEKCLDFLRACGYCIPYDTSWDD